MVETVWRQLSGTSQRPQLDRPPDSRRTGSTPSPARRRRVPGCRLPDSRRGSAFPDRSDGSALHRPARHRSALDQPTARHRSGIDQPAPPGTDIRPAMAAGVGGCAAGSRHRAAARGGSHRAGALPAATHRAEAAGAVEPYPAVAPVTGGAGGGGRARGVERGQRAAPADRRPGRSAGDGERRQSRTSARWPPGPATPRRGRDPAGRGAASGQPVRDSRVSRNSRTLLGAGARAGPGRTLAPKPVAKPEAKVAKPAARAGYGRAPVPSRPASACAGA